MFNVLIFLLFFLLQFLLSIYAYLTLRNLKSKYAIELESGATPAEFLERVLAEKSKPIKTSNKIKVPIKFGKNAIFVKTSLLHKTDIFTNVTFLHTALNNHNSVKFFKTAQQVLIGMFLFSIILFAVLLIFPIDYKELLLIFCISIEIVCILFSFYLVSLKRKLLWGVYKKSVSLLKLNEQEKLFVKAFLREFSLSPLQYPFLPVKFLLSFLGL